MLLTHVPRDWVPSGLITRGGVGKPCQRIQSFIVSRRMNVASQDTGQWLSITDGIICWTDESWGYIWMSSSESKWLQMLDCSTLQQQNNWKLGVRNISVKASLSLLWHCFHWHCWLGVRKSIQSVKNWVMRCWRGYLSAARCKSFAYGPADATATPSSLATLKSRLFYPF